MFYSQTYGRLEIKEIPDKILDYYNKMKHYDTPIKIIVGTDSQNFSDTKMVIVIAVVCEGHGGIFFSQTTRQPRITDVRTKLHVETNNSLEVAMKLTSEMEKPQYEELFCNTEFSIHIDAGTNPKGKTKEFVSELVGWILACGYDCEIKPSSFVASSIADKLSK